MARRRSTKGADGGSVRGSDAGGRPPGTGREHVRDPRKYIPGGSQQFKAQSILATFNTPEAARRAAEALREAGYETQVDEMDASPAGGDATDRPWPVSLSDAADNDTRALKAMDPALSGMADQGGDPQCRGQNILLTVVVKNDRFDPARRIIRRHGGEFDGEAPTF